MLVHLLVLILVGYLVWILINAIPMSPNIKTIVRVILALIAILILLNWIGLLPGDPWIRPIDR